MQLTQAQLAAVLTDAERAGRQIHLTSDLHLDHKTLVEKGYRPYGTVPEMNAAIITAWNAGVGDDDIVIVTGDLALGHRARSLLLLAQLNGTIVLIPGNHDYVWPHNEHYKQEWIDAYAEFVIVAEPGTYTISGRQIVLAHFPYGTLDHDNGDPPRYMEHRPVDEGLWLWHGHVHGEYGRIHHGRQIDVGVDAWGEPVTVERLFAAMDAVEAQAA